MFVIAGSLSLAVSGQLAWMATFESDYSGKIKFCVAIAKAVKAMCAITPGLNEATFIDDVKRGTTLWGELGEPTWEPSESPSVPVEEGAAE